MSNRDQHIIHALRRWIQGDIDRDAENRLDRHAREDRFLEEALEGYRQFPEGKHQERLDRMREQLAPNTQRDRKGGLVLFSLPYRIAAAAAVVLAVGLFWWLNPTNSTELAEAAKVESPTEDQASRPAAEPALPVEEEQASESEETTSLTITNSSDAEPTPAPSQSLEKPEAAGEQVPPLAEQSDVAEQSSPTALPRDLPNVRAYRAPELEVTPQSGSRSDSNIAPPPPYEAAKRSTSVPVDDAKLESLQGTRLVTGEVLDPSGTPLSGVLVLTPGKRTGTITNPNGKYEILLDSNAQKLEFQRSGYASQRIDISESASFVPVTLEEGDAVLNEVIIVGQANKKSRKNQVDPTVEGAANTQDLAEPVGGFRRFRRYLRRSLQYPQEAIDQGSSGEVTLSFTVQSDGKLTNIRVIQSPSVVLQEEALRLLNDGPKWKIKNNQDTATLSYRFNFSF